MSSNRQSTSPEAFSSRAYRASWFCLPLFYFFSIFFFFFTYQFHNIEQTQQHTYSYPYLYLSIPCITFPYSYNFHLYSIIYFLYFKLKHSSVLVTAFRLLVNSSRCHKTYTRSNTRTRQPWKLTQATQTLPAHESRGWECCKRSGRRKGKSFVWL